MSWESEIEELKKDRDARQAKVKQDAAERNAKADAERKTIERHLLEVVVPVFNEVAAALKKNGFVADVKQQTVSTVIPGFQAVQYLRGVSLHVSSKPISSGHPAEGVIQFEHSTGTAYTKFVRAGTTGNDQGGTSIEELTKAALEKLVREVVVAVIR